MNGKEKPPAFATVAVTIDKIPPQVFRPFEERGEHRAVGRVSTSLDKGVFERHCDEGGRIGRQANQGTWNHMWSAPSKGAEAGR